MVAIKGSPVASLSSFISPPPARPFVARRISSAPLADDLRQFIKSAETQRTARAWLESDDIKAYVRKGIHYIEGKKLTTLDIASVTVAEDKRGQGIFTRFLNMAHEMNPWDATHIESVQEDRFANYFWTRDWEVRDDTSRSFYKKKNHGTFVDAWTRSKRIA